MAEQSQSRSDVSRTLQVEAVQYRRDSAGRWYFVTTEKGGTDERADRELWPLLDEIVSLREAPVSERLPIKPDRIEAYDFFDITLTFHSSRERNEAYEFLKRQYERPE